MKTKAIIVTAAFVSAGLCAFKLYDDILKKLGITSESATYSIHRNVFTNNVFSLPRATLLATAVKGDKKALAKELCIYVRTYCESDAFATAYQQYRESMKPTTEPPKTMDAVTIKQMEDLAKMYEEWSNDKNYDAATRQNFKKDAESIRKQLEQEKDPTPNKTKWEKEYPADPSGAVKKKLEEALAILASVDFKATTSMDRYNKLRFDNPEYEKQSRKWKACYRAGKEVCDEVQVFITTWLKEGVRNGKPSAAVSEKKAGTPGNTPAAKEEKNEVPATEKEPEKNHGKTR